jgi:hypothetical protein
MVLFVLECIHGLFQIRGYNCYRYADWKIGSYLFQGIVVMKKSYSSLMSLIPHDNKHGSCKSYTTVFCHDKEMIR